MSNARTTKSRLLLNRQPEIHEMLRTRCDIVAMKGGTYAITTHYTGCEWVTDYEINWPTEKENANV